ncbi:MAG TPA: Crp/Fnr family transcriptional regulator [Allosphingosinicella sp.]|jgi:CRP-like cAMP-binding protein
MSHQPQPPLQPLLQKLAYWGKFDAADEEAILGLPHRVKLLERHGYIAREREITTQSCVLLSGYAIRHKIVVGGSRQIVAVHMKGDVVDLQNSFLGVADHSVQTLTESEVAFIPAEALKQLAFDRPSVGLAMWVDTLVDGSIFREWIANVGRRNAHARIAHLLCEFSLRLKVAGLGEATQYELPMTQEQLADCTGLTPVHVNRTLKTLEAENLIKRVSSRAITIGDWKKLADAGDFDSTYLHLRPEEPALD